MRKNFFKYCISLFIYLSIALSTITSTAYAAFITNSTRYNEDEVSFTLNIRWIETDYDTINLLTNIPYSRLNDDVYFVPCDLPFENYIAHGDKYFSGGDVTDYCISYRCITPDDYVYERFEQKLTKAEIVQHNDVTYYKLSERELDDKGYHIDLYSNYICCIHSSNIYVFRFISPDTPDETYLKDFENMVFSAITPYNPTKIGYYLTFIRKIFTDTLLPIFLFLLLYIIITKSKRHLYLYYETEIQAPEKVLNHKHHNELQYLLYTPKYKDIHITITVRTYLAIVIYFLLIYKLYFHISPLSFALLIMVGIMLLYEITNAQFSSAILKSLIENCTTSQRRIRKNLSDMISTLTVCYESFSKEHIETLLTSMDKKIGECHYYSYVLSFSVESLNEITSKEKSLSAIHEKLEVLNSIWIEDYEKIIVFENFKNKYSVSFSNISEESFKKDYLKIMQLASSYSIYLPTSHFK